jgi:uncharacterized phage infection (PIP) family protein YhgE
LDVIRLALASALYAYRSFGLMDPTLFAAQKLLIPLGQVTFFSFIGSYLGDRGLDFYLLGNAVLTASITGFFVSWTIHAEREAGTLIYLVGSPANRAAVFFGRTLCFMIDGVLFVAIGLFWAVVAFGLSIDPAAWGSMLLVLVVATVAASGAGLLVGGLSYVVLDAVILGNCVTYVLYLAGGANIPVESLPALLQSIGQALPITRSIAASRLVAAGGSLTEAVPLLLGDLLLGVGYGVAGLVLLRWLEAEAKRRGTLEAV